MTKACIVTINLTAFLKKSKGGEGEEKKSEKSYDLNPLPATPIGRSI